MPLQLEPYSWCTWATSCSKCGAATWCACQKHVSSSRSSHKCGTVWPPGFCTSTTTMTSMYFAPNWFGFSK